MCDLLDDAELAVLDALPEVALPVGSYDRPGRPNLAMGSVPLFSTPVFRAYLITAHGKCDLLVATKGLASSLGHKGSTSAYGLTEEQCVRVALGYHLRLGLRMAQAAQLAA